MRATHEGDLVGARARSASSWPAARTCSSVTFLPSQLRSTRFEHDADRDRQALDLHVRGPCPAAAANRTCRPSWAGGCRAGCGPWSASSFLLRLLVSRETRVPVGAAGDVLAQQHEFGGIVDGAARAWRAACRPARRTGSSAWRARRPRARTPSRAAPCRRSRSPPARRACRPRSRGSASRYQACTSGRDSTSRFMRAQYGQSSKWYMTTRPCLPDFFASAASARRSPKESSKKFSQPSAALRRRERAARSSSAASARLKTRDPRRSPRRRPGCSRLLASAQFQSSAAVDVPRSARSAARRSARSASGNCGFPRDSSSMRPARLISP